MSIEQLPTLAVLGRVALAQTIAEDTIVPLGQMIAGGLSSENIPQEPYYGMGRQRGLLDIGHPGIGEEKQKRRTEYLDIICQYKNAN